MHEVKQLLYIEHYLDKIASVRHGLLFSAIDVFSPSLREFCHFFVSRPTWADAAGVKISCLQSAQMEILIPCGDIGCLID